MILKNYGKLKITLSNEIRSHLINLKKYLPEALLHTKFKDVPRTNNLIESFLQSNTTTENKKYLHDLRRHNE